MGVMIQTFYWDCSREDKKEYQWWNYIRENIPAHQAQAAEDGGVLRVNPSLRLVLSLSK